MSLISSFKKALGFSADFEEDDDTDFVSDTASPPALPDKESSENTESGTDCDDSLPGDLFDALIELFNNIQPDFVRKCINTEQQRQYILESLNSGIKRRLESVMENARKKASRDNDEAQKRMAADLARMREQNSALETKQHEYQSAQLSASRQKRAFSERIHDLENQVANLEAEKEQYQLENRSMANKLRVAAVKNGDGEDADSKITQLAEENIKLNDEVSALRKKIDELESAYTENSHDAALEEIALEIEKFENLKKQKDAKINELKAENSEYSTRIQELERKLDTSKSDCESLRKTIENNLYAQAKNENELNNKIAELTESLKNAESAHQPTTQPVQQSTAQKRRNKKKPVISAIDDLMESTDWFVAQEPTPIKKSPDSEDDFGYKEPVKKINKDDDKQLSLF